MSTPDPQKRGRAAAKKTVLPDRVAAEACASEAARLQLDIEQISVNFKREAADLKERFKKQIDDKAALLKKLVEQLNTWAVVNREAVFGDAKTITLLGHELSFRDSPGKVAFEKGVNEEAVVQALLALADDEWADQFLRYTTELNREAVGDKWENEKDILLRLGLRLEKPEIFSFKPDLDSTPSAKQSVEQSVEQAAPAAALKEAA